MRSHVTPAAQRDNHVTDSSSKAGRTCCSARNNSGRDTTPNLDSPRPTFIRHGTDGHGIGIMTPTPKYPPKLSPIK